ncbi:MAG: hypothetical protein V3W41_01505 [Planctomycetota bacterium]
MNRLIGSGKEKRDYSLAPIWGALARRRSFLGVWFTLSRYCALHWLMFARGYRRLALSRNHRNGFYVVLIQERVASQKVHKVLRYDGFRAFEVYRGIRGSGFSRFQQALTGLVGSDSIGLHVCCCHRAYRSGSYESEFVQGVNLLQVQWWIDGVEAVDFSDVQLAQIRDGIVELSKNLERYQLEHQVVPGDWQPYNLIFDEARGRIVNVDLEGFYSHESADMDIIQGQLSELVVALSGSLGTADEGGGDEDSQQ